jgi:hypothetical protein
MINKEYIKASIESGIKVGDTVKVLRKAKDFEQGWGNAWTVSMSENIGSESKVVRSDNGCGFTLCDGMDYPYFVLKLVKDSKTTAVQNGKVLIRHLTKTPYKATLTGVVIANCLNIGISLCTPEDNFSREKGRKKSGERAYNNPTRIFFVADEKEAKVLFHSFANILQHDLVLPQTQNTIKRAIELTKPKVNDKLS